MIRISTASSIFLLALFGGVFACSSADSEPSPNPSEASEEEIRKKKDAGTPAKPDASTPADVCGGPPIRAFCAPCPGGINGYKQVNGKPTCACCNAPASDAGSGTCCDPATKPPPGIEGTWCCADGSWQYDIGSGNPVISCKAHGGTTGPVCGGE